MGRRGSGRAFGNAFGQAFAQGAELGTGVMRQRMAQDFEARDQRSGRKTRESQDRINFYRTALQDYQKIQAELSEDENRQAIAADVSGSQESAFKATLAALAGDRPISEVLAAAEGGDSEAAALVMEAANITRDRLEAQLPPDVFTDTTRKFLLSDLYNLSSGFENYIKAANSGEDVQVPAIRFGPARQAGLGSGGAPDFLDYLASVDPFLTAEQLQADLQDPQIGRVIGPMLQPQAQPTSMPAQAPQQPGQNMKMHGGGPEAARAGLEISPTPFQQQGPIGNFMEAVGPEIEAAGSIGLMNPALGSMPPLQGNFLNPGLGPAGTMLMQFLQGQMQQGAMANAGQNAGVQPPTMNPQGAQSMAPPMAQSQMPQQTMGPDLGQIGLGTGLGTGPSLGPSAAPDPEEFMRMLNDAATIRTMRERDQLMQSMMMR